MLFAKFFHLRAASIPDVNYIRVPVKQSLGHCEKYFLFCVRPVINVKREIFIGELRGFEHPLLKRLSFEGSYQGGSLPAGRRSILLRARLAEDRRTLADEDITAFRAAFERFLAGLGLELRR